MKKIIIVGGGAAGMAAAVFALRAGAGVTLIDKNEKLGKKVYITGKGRCNLTNACPREEFFKNIVRNPRFFYAAFARLSNADTISLVEELGCKVKIERGERAFPESDKSSDVIAAFCKEIRRLGGRVLYDTHVRGIAQSNGRAAGVITDEGEIPADAVIVATGGASYPSTGSTGEGYEMLSAVGHSITALRPGLVPLETNERWCASLTGLSLKNVRLSAFAGGKKFYSEMGEMLFTHFGISGPLVLTLSSLLPESGDVELKIDLKPALDEATLDARILRDFSEMKNRHLMTVMDGLEPHSLGEKILNLIDVSPYIQVNSVTAQTRRLLVKTLKGLPLTLKGARGMDEAVITQGGASVREFNPSTLESKLLPGLFAAGEVLDIDALTGGFNLQIAFSTGALAGESAAKEV